MSSRSAAVQKTSDFTQLLREFLAAHAELSSALAGSTADDLRFGAIAQAVGDDDRSVLYRLKQRSHGLFRGDGFATEAVRRDALFDLAIGSLFHEAMKLRESLYQREVYAPRLASLRAAADGESDALLGEFERLIARSTARIDDVVAEVRILLAQTRDQFRRLLIERADERGVTRCLVGSRAQVDATFPEGFEGLLEAMHGDVATGLTLAAHALLDSAYFVEADQTLREAAHVADTTRNEIDTLRQYAGGMQLFLEGDYAGAVQALEVWIDLGGTDGERVFARRAAAAIGRVGRLLDDDAAGAAVVDAAKQLQLRLDTASG